MFVFVKPLHCTTYKKSGTQRHARPFTQPKIHLQFSKLQTKLKAPYAKICIGFLREGGSREVGT